MFLMGITFRYNTYAIYVDEKKKLDVNSFPRRKNFIKLTELVSFQYNTKPAQSYQIIFITLYVLRLYIEYRS